MLKFVKNNRGAEAIELAIAIPLFFAFVFGFIDLGRLANGYSTVREAAAVGARFAVATEREIWESVSMLPWSGGKLTVASDTFVSAPSFVDHPNQSGWYQTKAASQLPSSEIYVAEVQAMAIANTIMQTHVGYAKYPCEQKDCFHCFTLRNTDEMKNLFSYSFDSGATRIWTSTVLGINCTYYVPMSTFLFGLGWLPDHIEVHANVYVPVNNAAGITYVQ